jgi:hypothetical protein
VAASPPQHLDADCIVQVAQDDLVEHLVQASTWFYDEE